MTLYQRIYASSKGKKKQESWLIGVFEWPIMAFMGVIQCLLSAASQGMFAGIDASTTT
jgi:hypothetical protein